MSERPIFVCEVDSLATLQTATQAATEILGPKVRSITNVPVSIGKAGGLMTLKVFERQLSAATFYSVEIS